MKLMLKNLRFDSIKADIVAGITVALVLIPQSLAYAQLAGLPVTFGLYAALLPPFVAALFGSSKQLSTGPVAVLSLMTAAAITPYADPGTAIYATYAVLLAVCLGVFQILLGVLKLGGLISFLSHPVVYGFTNAAALVIATTQLSKFFGVSVGTYEHHYQTVLAVIQQAIFHTDVTTLIFGLTAFGVMYLLKKINTNIPAVLLVVFFSILISWIFQYKGSIVGYIPPGIPALHIPVIDLAVLPSMILTIITMGLIGFTEAISIAQAIAVKNRDKVNPNRELIGQGIANLVGAFTGAYPVAGSFSRTAVNYQAGARSWMSSMFTSIVVLITLLFFTRLLFYLPQVVLASVIVLSVSGLLDMRKLGHIWNNSKFDALAALITFSATLYYAPHLEKGVILGVVCSISYYVYRNARPRIVFLSKYRDGALHDVERFRMDRCKNIAVVRLDAPLFFANSRYFENEIIDDLAKNKNTKYVLLDGSGINEIDATGEEMLSSMLDLLKESGKDLYFSHMKGQILDVLTRSGFTKHAGSNHFFATTPQAMMTLIARLEHKHAHIDQASCPLQMYIKKQRSQLTTNKDKRETIAYFYHKLIHQPAL